MAAITIKQPSEIRRGLILIGEGQQGIRQLHGVGQFNGTDASGTLIVPGLRKIQHVQLTAMGIPSALYEVINIPLGTISATASQCFAVPHTGTVTQVAFGTANLISAHADNHWTFRLINQNEGNSDIITADSSNSTDADSTPVGFTIGGDFPHVLFQAAAPADAVIQFETLKFTATKAAAATTMTGAFLELVVTIGGTDENLYVQANSDGSIPITSGAITIQRTGNIKTSDLQFSFTVTGF